MKLPFHGVQVCGDILFAARGGNIHSCKLTDGSHISCWKYPVDIKDGKSITSKLIIDVSENSTPAPSQDEQGPPAKRVKLDSCDAGMPGENGETEQGADIKPTGGDEDEGNDTPDKGKKNKKHLARPGPLSQPSERPMVIIMTATKDGSHVIAVTSDKSIWVFEHDGQGQLTQLSRRTMPKRPCSVVLTPDNKDILVADKFGDVYSLPLIPSADPPAQPNKEASPGPAPAPASASPPPPASIFKPQASELTVHTKRNRRTLIDQQISRTNPKAMRGTQRRVDAAFERHLLLGHVSLLTAVDLGLDGRGRRYIITADRDEHIRVSRGTREQAHVTEAFCLGHEAFVNRLCIPEGMGHVLVSAGGDNEVFVWRWREGRLLARTDLMGAVQKVVPSAAKVAVTGLCCWWGGPMEGTRMVVYCERVGALFVFILKDTGSLEFSRTITLPGNPLEVEVVDERNLVVAVDPSQKEAGEYELKKSLLKVEHVDGEYQISDDLVKDLPDVSKEDADVSDEELQRLLYSAENLRKLDSDDAGADAE